MAKVAGASAAARRTQNHRRAIIIITVGAARDWFAGSGRGINSPNSTAQSFYLLAADTPAAANPFINSDANWFHFSLRLFIIVLCVHDVSPVRCADTSTGRGADGRADGPPPVAVFVRAKSGTSINIH